MIYTKPKIENLYWLRMLKRQLIVFIKTKRTVRSKTVVYDQYSTQRNKDLELYFNKDLKRDSIVNNKLVITSNKVIRDHHVSLISKFVDEERPDRVLEIGAGDSLNIFLLQKRHPDVEFYGIDLVPNRVHTGRQYFERKWGFSPNTIVADATNLPFEDNYFDLVFSVHCFEQMERDLTAAVQEAVRVCRNRLIFLEPDWKYSNLVQKLFILNEDYLRSFDKVLKSIDGEFIHKKVCTYHNPLNRTGLFTVVLNKGG